MRVTFILSSLRLSGGVHVVVEYANRLAARGHAVNLVAPGGTLDAEMITALIPSVSVRHAGSMRGPRLPIGSMMALTWSLARAAPPSDVVVATHTPTIVPTVLATLRHPSSRAWLYMDYAEMFEGRPIERWLLARGPAWFAHVLTLSETGRQDAMRAGARRVTVVGLGISDTHLFTPRDAPGQPAAVAMYLGDARPRKGLTEFLAASEIAARRVPDLGLLVVTKEPTEIQSSLPCEIVVRPRREDLPDLYRRGGVFVSSSWGEGFGLPPLEAMACGTPVVLTDSHGVREYARPEENSLMVPSRDPQALAAAMIRVLTDSALAENLRRNGPATAARFAWDDAVDRFERAIRSCTGRT